MKVTTDNKCRVAKMESGQPKPPTISLLSSVGAGLKTDLSTAFQPHFLRLHEVWKIALVAPGAWTVQLGFNAMMG
jgi:hypothetical protein